MSEQFLSLESRPLVLGRLEVAARGTLVVSLGLELRLVPLRAGPVVLFSGTASCPKGMKPLVLELVCLLL